MKWSGCVPAECDSKLNSVISKHTFLQGVKQLVCAVFVVHALQKFTQSFKSVFLCLNMLSCFCCGVLLQYIISLGFLVFFFFLLLYSSRWPGCRVQSPLSLPDLCNVRKQRGTGSYPAITSNLATAKINCTSLATS